MTENDHYYIPYFLELKKRVLRCLIAYLLILTPLIFYARVIYSYFASPLLSILPSNSHLIASDITSPFMVPIKLALYLAFFIAMPFMLSQVWGFIAPALYTHEKKSLQFIIFLSISLFYIGLALAYGLVCPVALHFFTHMVPQGVVMMTEMGHYLDFVLKLMLAFGFAFQTPIICIVLIYFNILSIESLTNKRSYIIVASFIIGMLLTPPDVLSQILLAMPLWGLFELGLLIAKKLEHYKLNMPVS